MQTHWRHFRWVVLGLLILGAAFVLSVQSTPQTATFAMQDATPTAAPPVDHPQLYENSFHMTAGGMEYWYSAENGGFQQLTGIAWEQLGCSHCHVESTDDCQGCHVTPANVAPPQGKCLACHGRQNAEVHNANAPDVHRQAGMTCVNCHSMEKTHGDGNAYNSLWESPPAATCEDCHAMDEAGGVHPLHMESVDCSACHVSQVVNCYNCHFDSMVEEGKKVPNTQFWDTRLLVEREGKLRLGTFMAMVYQDKSFVALAPFMGHTIQVPDSETLCDQCHNNPYIQTYEETGTITVTDWDESQQKIVNSAGTIPVPPDYESALKFDFVTKDAEGNWTFLRDTAELMQFMYAEPVTEMPPQFK